MNRTHSLSLTPFVTSVSMQRFLKPRVGISRCSVTKGTSGIPASFSPKNSPRVYIKEIKATEKDKRNLPPRRFILPYDSYQTVIFQFSVPLIFEIPILGRKILFETRVISVPFSQVLLIGKKTKQLSTSLWPVRLMGCGYMHAGNFPTHDTPIRPFIFYNVNFSKRKKKFNWKIYDPCYRGIKCAALLETIFKSAVSWNYKLT